MYLHSFLPQIFKIAFLFLLFFFYIWYLINPRLVTNWEIALSFFRDHINFRYILCGVFKQESMYLKEWTKYHLDLGFDKVILINNNDNQFEDQEVIKEITKDTRIVVLDRIRHFHNIPKWYEEVYNQLMDNEWCLFADIDEFFNVSWSLNHYFEVAKSNGCHQIKLNWLVFGNNGNIVKTNGTLIERFPKPVIKILPNYHISKITTKPLIRGGLKNIKWKSWHHAVADGMQGCNGDLHPISDLKNDKIVLSPATYNISFLSHYFTKSEQEWCFKMIRHKNKAKKINDYKWKLYDQVNFYKPNIARTKKINENCTFVP